jgi:hypothetical protein
MSTDTHQPINSMRKVSMVTKREALEGVDGRTDGGWG